MSQSPWIGHIKAERSSRFASCGVRWRQSRSSSREWIRLEKIERDHGTGDLLSVCGPGKPCEECSVDGN